MLGKIIKNTLFSRKSVLMGLVLGLFFIVSVVGTGAMILESSWNMTANCLFVPEHSMSICKANPLEHIGEWQSMFTAVLNEHNTFALLLLLLVSVMASVLICVRRVAYPPPASSFELKRLYIKACTLFVSPLREAFRKGTIHSQIYGIVTVF